MKTSYSNTTKSSIMKGVGFDDLERVEFIKRKDIDESKLIGASVKGILYIKKKKNMRSDSSSLAIIGTDGRAYLLTVPTWVGSAILEDFNKLDQTAEEYFGGYVIEGFRDITTKDGNNTFDVLFTKSVD